MARRRSEKPAPERPPTSPPADLAARVIEIDGESFLLLRYSDGRAEEPWPEGVTASEQAVARLIIDGLSNREIARRRGTSVATVSNQLRSLYAKLDIHSRAELAAWFVRGNRR
jgi:DNA-binding NarL/FixJ family response regulator